MLIDKPAGMTSHDVVARVRRALGIRSVGHTGTLDPFATGLLVVLVGRATRLARFLEPLAKRYRGVARLGVRTETDDGTGQVVSRVEPAGWPGRDEVREAMAGLTGRQEQVPPMFSAKRVEGTRSYRLARRGERPALRPVTVQVHALDLVRYEPPEVEFRASVSSGTYIRALARDLGEALGLGAHLTALRREAIGPLEVADAVPLAALGTATPLLPPAAVLGHLPGVELEAAEAEEVSFGRTVGRAGASGLARLEREGTLVAIAEAVAEGWHPIVVLEGR